MIVEVRPSLGGSQNSMTRSGDLNTLDRYILRPGA